MRKPIVHWLGRFDQPDSDRLLLFDFGLGPTLGNYSNGRFHCLKNSRQSWDRVLVNQWRYCELVEQPAVDRLAAA